MSTSRATRFAYHQAHLETCFSRRYFHFKKRGIFGLRTTDTGYGSCHERLLQLITKATRKRLTRDATRQVHLDDKYEAFTLIEDYRVRTKERHEVYDPCLCTPSKPVMAAVNFFLWRTVYPRAQNRTSVSTIRPRNDIFWAQLSWAKVRCNFLVFGHANRSFSTPKNIVSAMTGFEEARRHGEGPWTVSLCHHGCWGVS